MDKNINTHKWNIIIWTAELSSFNQVLTLIIQIKLYKHFHVYKNTMVYSLEPRLQEVNIS
jgi:hypothetical protein